MPGYTYFAMVHALFGTAALITFWSAAWMKKGSPRHRAIGKVFLLTMCGVIVSGIPLVIEQVFIRQRLVGGVFLAYLLPLTAQACWLAWRAITDKRDWRVMTARIGWHLVLWLPVLAAIPVLVVGVMKMQWLLMGFSMIAFINGAQMLRFARRGPHQANWHVVQHYQAMLGAGVATHIAFLGIGMQPVWRWLKTTTDVPPTLIELFPWFAPLAVAMLAGVWLGRKYGTKHTPRTTGVAAQETPATR